MPEILPGFSQPCWLLTKTDQKKKKNLSLSGPSPTAVAKCDRLGEMGAETPTTVFKLKCFTFGEEG